jgi:hypothetical protein
MAMDFGRENPLADRELPMGECRSVCIRLTSPRIDGKAIPL